MPKTVVRENESLDDALRRFKDRFLKLVLLLSAEKRVLSQPGVKQIKV